MSHLWRLMDFPLARLPQLSGEKAGLIKWFICTFPPPVMDGTSTFPWNFIISQLQPLSHDEMWERNETDRLQKKKTKQKQTNHRVTSFTDLLRWGECGNMMLSALMPLNHSPTSSRTKILARSGLQLIATSPLIDSFIWPQSFGVLCFHCIATRAGQNDACVQHHVKHEVQIQFVDTVLFSRCACKSCAWLQLLSKLLTSFDLWHDVNNVAEKLHRVGSILNTEGKTLCLRSEMFLLKFEDVLFSIILVCELQTFWRTPFMPTDCDFFIHFLWVGHNIKYLVEEKSCIWLQLGRDF